MALSIRNAEVEADVRALATATGESMTQAIQGAVRARLRLVHAATGNRSLADRIADIQRAAKRNLRDAEATPDELLGYPEVEGVE